MADEFEPLIVAFCCNWCSYAGADNAGVGRRQMPPNFRIIRTMCSARIDPDFVLRALSKGADGVIVLGCHPADCHYIGGNYRAKYGGVTAEALVESAMGHVHLLNKFDFDDICISVKCSDVLFPMLRLEYLQL